MKSIRIELKREGYDPFIDYLKGISIFFVILQHCTPPVLQGYTLFALWARFSVPLFLLVQVFHVYKVVMGGGNFKLNSKKIWTRIFAPFFVVQSLIVIYKILWESKTPSQMVHQIIYGGFGPGAYYPWIYVQMAIALPLFIPLIVRYNRLVLAVFFVLMAQMLEIVCCVTDMPTWLFRLCFFRFFFIIYLGYVLAKDGLVINKYAIFFAAFGVICLWLFTFNPSDLRPYFYTGIPSWKIFHWPNYIYMFYVLFPLLWYSWRVLRHNVLLKNYVLRMGKYSYEIFLFQMIWFSIVGKLSGSESMRYQMIFMIASILMCILPVVYIKSKFDTLKFIKNN